MFDRIAWRYDLLNRMLSLGSDVRWRKRMALHLPPGENLKVLDLATGTADQILMLAHTSSRVGPSQGMDLSEGMLEIGRRKVKEQGMSHLVTLSTGDATAIPAPDNTYDAVTISFGIRNVENVAKGLSEMLRVLKPGGRALILEGSLPDNAFMRKLYLVYFRHVLPRVGAWVSGDGGAYAYLNRTVETFPCGERFCDLMRAAGFREVSCDPRTFGVATIYRGDKPVP